MVQVEPSYGGNTNTAGPVPTENSPSSEQGTQDSSIDAIASETFTVEGACTVSVTGTMSGAPCVIPVEPPPVQYAEFYYHHSRGVFIVLSESRSRSRSRHKCRATAFRVASPLHSLLVHNVLHHCFTPMDV